jgi:hypothetical protein
MNVLRAVVVGLIGLSGTGCLIGFDAGRLTGGAADGGSASPGTAGSDSPGAGDMSHSPTSCDDFSGYTPGMPLPNWVDGRGTWRVLMMAQGKMLAQTTSPTSRSDRFVAWQAGKDYTDASISAVATLCDQTDMNCVLARVQDATNYYALCVVDAGRNRTTSHEWRLDKVVAGVETHLAGAAITTNGSHTIAFRVQGSTLNASVDGQGRPAVIDETFSHGLLGVSTDEAGGFMTLCTVGQ